MSSSHHSTNDLAKSRRHHRRSSTSGSHISLDAATVSNERTSVSSSRRREGRSEDASKTQRRQQQQQPPPPPQQQQQRRRASSSSEDDFDFKQYLGLSEAAGGSSSSNKAQSSEAFASAPSQQQLSTSTMFGGGCGSGGGGGGGVSTGDHHFDGGLRDFREQLGLLSEPGVPIEGGRGSGQHRRQSVMHGEQMNAIDVCSPGQDTQHISNRVRAGLQAHTGQQKSRLKQPPPPPPPLPPVDEFGEPFAEEFAFYRLVDGMLARAEADSRCDALRHYVDEFGERVAYFRTHGGLQVFPFYQPELPRILDLMAGCYLAVGDAAADSELLLLTERLRCLRLQMCLFLWPETANDAAEVDDAALVRLLLAYSEHLVEQDLFRGRAGDKQQQPPGRHARRRATALAAAVAQYARTAERRRQLVLGSMQSLAASATGFVARPCASEEADSFRQAVATLLDNMLACFACLEGGGGGSGGGNGDNAMSSAKKELKEEDGKNEEAHEFRSTSAAAAADATAASTAAAAAAASYAGFDDSDEEKAAPTAADTGDGGSSVASDGLESPASVEPLEALSLQFMERVEALFLSFLPNERVNAQEFKTGFSSLCSWWRRTCAGNVGRGIERRMSAVRERYERAHRHGADCSGVQRLCSESETAWELIEMAKVMLATDRRSAALAEAHTAPEWRETTLTLVDATLATLYLYQLSQDASVLSTRLRTDLQRLTGRLADCGPVPLLGFLRLRLLYMRARQYADLLRAQPQGCLILELAQTHRMLHRDAYPEDASSSSSSLNLSVCVPVNDYRKFCQHIKDIQVLSLEARAPATENVTNRLIKNSCLRKIEKCCQCSIEVVQPGCEVATTTSSAGSPATSGGLADDAATSRTSGGATSTSRRRSQPLRPSFTLVIRPEVGHGRANAAMRMICDAVGPAGVREQVKFRRFHLAFSLPRNFRPLAVFAETSRQFDE